MGESQKLFLRGGAKLPSSNALPSTLLHHGCSSTSEAAMSNDIHVRTTLHTLGVVYGGAMCRISYKRCLCIHTSVIVLPYTVPRYEYVPGTLYGMCKFKLKYNLYQEFVQSTNMQHTPAVAATRSTCTRSGHSYLLKHRASSRHTLPLAPHLH